MTKISEATPDASVSGVELVPVSDDGTPKSVSMTQIKQFVIDAIEAVSASGSITNANSVFTLQDGNLKPETVATISQHIIDTIWDKTAESSPDGADVLPLKDGLTEKTVTLTALATFIRTNIEAAILNVSSLAVHSSLVADDKFLVTNGTTGKYCTYTTLFNAIYASLNAYVTALTAVATSADADVLYCIQGGTEKKVTRSVLLTGVGDTIAPSSMTENSVPQWDSASKTLKDGLTVRTSVRATGSAVHTALATESAVRALVSALVYNQSDIGGALADADTIMVDDGNLGTTQRKTTFTRIWTWITSKLQGLSAKLSPVDGDVITIQDSGNSNALASMTIETLASHLDARTPSDFMLSWVAGCQGKPGLNADIQNTAESTRMVTDPDFEVLGTNASSGDVTFYVEGGLKFETDGSDGDEVILIPHLDTNQSAWSQVTWGTDQQTRWECRIKTGSNITNCIIWAGLKLTNTEVTATDDNQAFFRYEDDVNSGNWQAVASIGGTDSEEDAGVAVAVDTDYRLVIDIQNDRSAKFYINDVLVYTSNPLTDATDLIPCIGVAADGAAAAKSLIVRSQSIRRNFA